MGVAVYVGFFGCAFGFKREIREKISGFAGHIQVALFHKTSSLEPSPISIKTTFSFHGQKSWAELEVLKGLLHYKAGIIRNDDIIQGPF
jgi:hypothetical protein